MGDDRFHVDVAQLRAHADNIDAIRERFGAVKSASAHIAQDDQAYGLLCGWISGVLESKHAKQDELVAYLEETLDLVATRLRLSASHYETVEGSNTDKIRSAGEGVPT
ncbi:type VII secretion target [Kibdelosporangium phytohabitans]|uniref:Excreted virulence factor EspC (Type VII ESX diderm) n=1 Tax=Kibdelosporangium phytohabitans TaxID=860235 RepID=A0A0N9I6F2_9PSEU|nr:type VII secretion target [Kibdelosporangium phytohabitans]ALG10329.1 hypothetical protein AOZ06_28610 [Kibdelosporangium phytohabitans]MBE1461371.1 hypothetical protein [Kibdelosporangium phytohabitans]